MGLITARFQAEGIYPYLKHLLNNECRILLSFPHFKTSDGILSNSGALLLFNLCKLVMISDEISWLRWSGVRCSVIFENCALAVVYWSLSRFNKSEKAFFQVSKTTFGSLVIIPSLVLTSDGICLHRSFPSPIFPIFPPKFSWVLFLEIVNFYLL